MKVAGNRGIRSADRLISPEVAEVVAELATLPKTDAAAVKLAVRYAALIDDAAVDARYGAALRYLDRLVPVDDAAGRRHLQRIWDALAEQSTLSDLGPKLLATLEALGATPRARQAAAKPAGGGRGGKLQALRDARSA